MTSNSDPIIFIGGKISKKSSSKHVLKNKSKNLLTSNTKNDSDGDLNTNVGPDTEMHQTESAPSSSNLNIINKPSLSSRRILSTDESNDEYQQVTNKKSSKRKQKQLTPRQLQALNVPQVSHGDSDFPVTSEPAITQHDQHNPVLVNVNQHHSLAQQFTITNESTRYAQTRYPFPPFVLRFKSRNVKINEVKEGLIDHCKKIHQMDVQILNCRSSISTLSNNEYDILMYLKDVVSFSFLLEETHWPNLLGNESYSFSSSPSIPPQLCLLIKNVGLHIDFDEFCDDVKANYPRVKNIIRMKNKFQNDIKMVKLELTSSTVRDQLLRENRILINYISYDIVEYLAPANVLICSKCMGLGHFKKQCTQINDTCRTCGEQVVDLKNHNCSQVEKCIHCEQNHKSSSLKCPVVKSFRAELTRKILSTNQPALNTNMFNQNYIYNSSNFPPPPAPKASSINPMMNKLDELIGKMSEVKHHLTNLENKHDKFEKFMVEKMLSDELVKENFNDLSKNHLDLKKDVTQHSLLIERHENMFTKLLIPMFEDLFSVIASQNHDKRGNPLDADLKYKLERYLMQVKKAREGKHFSN
jgi:hypothetical protein